MESDPTWLASTRPGAVGPPSSRASARPARPIRRRGWGTALLAMLGPLAIWVAAIGLAARAASSELPEGQCGGIGFGCSLAPRDGALLLGWLVGVPAVGVATLSTMLALLLPSRVRATVVGVLLGVFALGTALVAGALSGVSFSRGG